MEELLKKINGNLIEIKTKLDKDTFHISGGSNNIGQQNITYSTFKKPITNYAYNIYFVRFHQSTLDAVSLFQIVTITDVRADN